MLESSGNAQIGKSMLQLIRYGLVRVANIFAIYFLYRLITYFGVVPKAAMTSPDLPCAVRFSNKHDGIWK